MIKYEFPLNERVRRFIRLEQLFNKTQSAILSSQKYSEFNIFERIFELMQTASRTDLKVDLMQEIERKIITLKKESQEFSDLLKSYQKIESGSKMWGMFNDFNFYSIEPLRAIYIEGFGKAYQKNYRK